MKRIIAMLTVAFVLAGCTAQYQVRSLSGTHNSVNLSKQEGVYIALPPDGEYGATKYTGSGQTVAQVLAVAFSRYATSVHTAEATAPQKLAIAAAAKSGDRYVVMPLITHWEPRNTAWSGKRSRVALQITVFDVTSGQALSSVSIEGKSAQQTLSSTSPEDLLQVPVSEYVGTLYH